MDPRPLPRVLVAALRGGSGKTTITLGLIQALADRGLKVAPFKKGPDYIDPFWHTEAAGRACRNLEPYLMGQDQVVRSFAYHTTGAEAAVVEGNRGLFDAWMPRAATPALNWPNGLRRRRCLSWTAPWPAARLRPWPWAAGSSTPG